MKNNKEIANIILEEVQEFKKTKDEIKNIDFKSKISNDFNDLSNDFKKELENVIKNNLSQNKAPNWLNWFFYVNCFLMILNTAGIYFYWNNAFKAQSIVREEYTKELLNKGAVISDEDIKLNQDMIKFFNQNPNTTKKFINSRKK